MKKITCFCLLSIFILTSLSAQEDQETDIDRNELKLNASNLIAFTFLDGTYERLINEESSFGVGLLFNVGSEEEIFDGYREFSITPFYRQFFSNSYAKGFFVEGFGMLNSGAEEVFFDDFGGITSSDEDYTDFALGVSVGGKFVTPRGFIAEIYAGIGRNLLGSNNSPEVVGRGGISLGFRF